MEDLKKLKMVWKETAKDRKSWRDLAETAKTHKGLCRIMMMVLGELTAQHFSSLNFSSSILNP
jgi:hypothetical protein